MKLLFLPLFLFQICFVQAGTLNEEEKVTKLLDLIEKSQLTFIRNGSEYDSKKARSHLEYKYNYVSKGLWFWSKPTKVSAIDFIEKLASKSSSSGKLYYIKTKEGIKVPSGDWLKSRLKEIESNQ